MIGRGLSLWNCRVSASFFIQMVSLCFLMDVPLLSAFPLFPYGLASSLIVELHFRMSGSFSNRALSLRFLMCFRLFPCQTFL